MVNLFTLKGDIPVSKYQVQFDKKILLEHSHEEIKEICIKFQEDFGASDIEIKTLLRELTRIWAKEN